MINIEELDKAILDLESHDTTYSVCEKLAWLYIVRDHVTGNTTPVAREKVSVQQESEFFHAVNGKDIVEVLNILDEHMNVVSILMPKEYEELIKQLYALET